MPDRGFTKPRLAAIYDALDSDRSDVDTYASIVEEFGAGRVLDIGCGTGTFACLLARRGVEVVGVDPARASLDVARHKPGADRVRWIHGVASDLPPLRVDLVTMTGNVAQVFLTDDEWESTLLAAYGALRPGGYLVFEAWVDLTDVSGDFVSFRWTYVFESDGAVLTSDSTLRFRTRSEIESSLVSAGFALDGVRDAPDRPGRELVFIAQR